MMYSVETLVNSMLGFKGALRSSGDEIQTQNFNIYISIKLITQTQTYLFFFITV